MHWIVEPEYIACVAILIIFCYTFQEHTSSLLKLRVFRISCGVSIFAILVNIASVFAIENASAIPLSLNVFINSMFLISTMLMLTSIAAYALVLLFEDRYEAKRLRHALIGLGVVYLIGIALTIANIRTGWIFSFDGNASYVRGPLNPIMYIALLADLIILVGCHFAERKHVSRSFSHVARAVVPMAAVIGFMQILRPDTMLTGTIAALTLLILFINGQQQRASSDHLTELFNRETFFELLSQSVNKKQPFRVIVISLRDYKMVNIRYGQRAGDRFLQVIGRYIHDVHPLVHTCRFSGVEFAIIVPDMTDAEFDALLEKLRARFTLPWRHASGVEAVIGASLAHVSYPDIVSTVDELMVSLEYAVRIAKSDPSHAIIQFDKKRKQELGRRSFVIDLITSAVLKDRFYLHYQPIYDVRRGCFTGAETLLRLREENGTPVSPGEFIPLAEEAGMISELSWLVLDRACRFLSENRESSIEWVSINVSAQEFRSREIVSRVFRTLDRYHLPHGMLKIEITERVILDDLAFTASLIHELRNGGVGVWLDDFGTGYSNLVNVAILPFECLKMDRMFLFNIESDTRARSLFRTIVHSAQELGMEVLAEGVETLEQVEFLHSVGLDRIQGFFYSRPLEGDAFLACMPKAEPEVQTEPAIQAEDEDEQEAVV